MTHRVEQWVKLKYCELSRVQMLCGLSNTISHILYTYFIRETRVENIRRFILLFCSSKFRESSKLRNLWASSISPEFPKSKMYGHRQSQKSTGWPIINHVNLRKVRVDPPLIRLPTFGCKALTRIFKTPIFA